MGGPALPRTTVRVAVPSRGWPRSVDIDRVRTILLTEGATVVVPVQRRRPGGCDDGYQRPDDPTVDDDDEDGDDSVRVERFPAPPMVVPDPALYEAAAGERLAGRASAIEQLGEANVVVVELWPIRLDEKLQLELTTELDIVIAYGARPAPLSGEKLRQLADAARPRGRSTGAHAREAHRLPAQAKRAAELATALVVNPNAVIDISHWFPELLLPAEYLVITDNRRWDAASITPGPATGENLVAAFQRLAAWKRSRGVTSRVVTVTDIVQGRYGDFRSGSRDLPEVIRKFLKWANESWGVAWLLLGGDVGIIPPRLAAGAVEGHMDPGPDNPPPDNLSFWTGSHLRMHVVNPGIWWPGRTGATLVNAATGQLIPFDATGASAGGGLGWYYTTDEAYGTRSAAATAFVRVNGPAMVVNARLQWLYEWNTIPTDFYYASLDSWVIAFQDIEAHVRAGLAALRLLPGPRLGRPRQRALRAVRRR